MTTLPPLLRVAELRGHLARLFGSRGRCAVLAVGIVALLLAHLLTALPRRPTVPLWSPTAGLAFVLVAWFGTPGALLVGIAGILGRLVLGESQALLLGLMDGVEAFAAYRLYQLLQGSRRLNDPRSATIFLLVAPAVVVGLSAILRAAVLNWTGTTTLRFSTLLALV